MNLEDLILQFSLLDNAVVGKGPKHPKRNDDAVKQELEQFLKDFPAFSIDQDLVRFFEQYGAIGIYPPDPPSEELELLTYGFDTDITLSIAHPDESLINDHYYRFAEILVYRDEQYISANYAIDINSQIETGIYHRVAPQDVGTRTVAYEHYCDNFASWLATLIESKGTIL